MIKITFYISNGRKRSSPQSSEKSPARVTLFLMEHCGAGYDGGVDGF